MGTFYSGHIHCIKLLSREPIQESVYAVGGGASESRMVPLILWYFTIFFQVNTLLIVNGS